MPDDSQAKVKQYKANRLPSFPGKTAWKEILPERKPSPQLSGEQHADFVVVGAGFAGLSAAHRLHQIDPDARIVVLDASCVAEGAAGRNSGFMIDLPHDISSDSYASANTSEDQTQIRLNRLAIQFATDLANTLKLDKSVFNACGKINGAATPKGHQHNIDYARHLAQLNEPCDLYDVAAMSEITGTSYYQSGLFTPGTVMLQPAAFIRAIADGLPANAQLFENSPVLELNREGSHWQVVSNAGSVSASKVILAVNGYVESFGFFKRRLMHVFTYGSMSHAMSDAQCASLGGHEQWNLTPADPMGVTVRRLNGIGGNRILVRSRFTYDPSMQVSKARMANVGKLHNKQFNERFPMLKGLQMEYRWAGHLCISRNNVHAFGEVDDNLFAACCQNGLGLSRGTMAGIAAAELATDTSSESVDALLSEQQPQKLPPEPFAWLGANATMRYKEMMSGRE